MLSKFNVLLVEDNPDKRALLKVALEMAGYNVQTAEDGVEGLQAVEYNQPDLIITDTTMPRMDGYEMVRRVRANPSTRFIPVIIQTALRGEAHDVRLGSEVGALGYITDPTDLDLLLARARTLLDFKNYLDSCEEAAFTDHSTGLANQRRFTRQLDREVARAKRFDRFFCFLLIEIGNFNRINEIYGYDVCLSILRSIATKLCNTTREIDTCARLDNALFGVLLTEEGIEKGQKLAEQLRHELKGIAPPDISIELKVNIGIVEFPTDAEGAEELYKAAYFTLHKVRLSRKAAFEAALAWLQSLLHDREGEPAPPSCFISYAWSTPENDNWVTTLAKDLTKAGIRTILDRRDNAAIGLSIHRFVISSIETSDFIIVIGTPLYKEKYENRDLTMGSLVAAEVDLIHARLLGTEEQKSTVLPLLREGHPNNALPPLMRGRVCGGFQSQEKYYESLFDLLLTLYKIPFNDPIVEDLRESLSSHTY